MADEIVQVRPGFMAPVVSVKDALLAYQAKKELIDGIMREGVDFGAVPGTSKNTLLKAGAEKATSFFGLFPRFEDAEVVNDWTGEQHGGEPFFYYRRTCNLWRGDVLVASVDGSCNSWEKKYRYRGGERTCPECGKAAIKKSKYPPKGDPHAAPGFYCYSKIGGCGAEFSADDPAIVGQELGQVKNPDVADLANTILKMADKRALVAATLIATGLSEYFTQDVEDFIDGAVTEIKSNDPATVSPEKPAQSLQGVKKAAPVDPTLSEQHSALWRKAQKAKLLTPETIKLWAMSGNASPEEISGKIALLQAAIDTVEANQPAAEQ